MLFICYSQLNRTTVLPNNEFDVSNDVFPCLDCSRYLYVLTNRYTMLNQKVLFLLQFFEDNVLIFG